jgi:DNA-binding XRE family transcriptional regulator
MRTELKIIRVKHHLNQKEMAKRCGTSLSTYNRIEQGKLRGSQDFWLAVQKEFNLDGETLWKMQNQQISD